MEGEVPEIEPERAILPLLNHLPDQVGVTAAERIQDLPGGGSRTIRQSLGLHGVFVNGTLVFDGENYLSHATGPGMVLDRFRSSQNNCRVSVEKVT